MSETYELNIKLDSHISLFEMLNYLNIFLFKIEKLINNGFTLGYGWPGYVQHLAQILTNKITWLLLN